MSSSSSGSTGLSADQKKRMEENRRKALALRASRQQTNPKLGTTFGYTGSNVSFSGQTSVAHTRPSQPNFHNTVSANGNIFNSVSKETIGPLRHTVTVSNKRPSFSGKPSTSPNTNSGIHQTKTSTGYNSAPRSDNAAMKPGTGSTSSSHTSPVGLFGQRKVSTKSSFAATGDKNATSSLKPTAEAVVSNSPQKLSGKKTEGKCVLISRNRFLVDAGYHPALIAVFKMMPTKQYDPQSRKWNFDLKDYIKLAQQMHALEGVHVEPLSRTVQLAFSKHLKGQGGERHVPEANLSAVAPNLVNTLMPFQRDGVNFGIWRDGRVLIADDMGLGKTFQAIAIASYYRGDWPLLIVVPSSVRFAWRDQLLKWVDGLDPQDINVTLTSKDSCVCGVINILSYDMMVRRVKELAQKAFQVIIMDESHALKSIKAARTQAAVVLLKKARQIILLSGTPALSRPSELFTQISAVDPKLFPKFHDFGLRYCEGRKLPWGWDFSGSSNLTELQLVLEEKVMIRRLKKDVLSQLPSKNRQMVILDPGSVKLNKNMRNSHKMVDKMKGQERRGALLEYFHETASAKVPAIREYVLDLLDSGKKFLIFAHHQEVLDELERALEQKCQYIRIDGKTTPEQRNYFCNKFQKDQDVKVAILSIMAANSGLNMTAASLVLFAELFWNPGILVQAEDRAHRIGQEDSVNVQYLIATGTADDYIWPLVQKKLDVLGQAGLTNREDFSDAGTTRLKDPKQLDLMAYFEESFIEDDIPEGNDSTNKSEAKPIANQPTTNPPTKATQSNMLQYFQTDQSKTMAQANPANQAADCSDDLAACDWLDELMEEEDPEAPWPKKLKLS